MWRPMLAPGLRVLRRPGNEVQVGVFPGRRVVLPATEPVRRALARLRRGEVLDDDPETADVLARLGPVLADARGIGTPGVAPGDVATAALLDPDDYPDLLARRRSARVAVDGSLGALDPAPLLAAAGLAVEGPGPTTAVLVLRVGDVDREELDPLVRSGVAHLVVRFVEGHAIVGPLVDPGRTACLRCIDAHRAAVDPGVAALATQLALGRDERRDGVPEPVDAATAALVVGWAVRDLVSHVDGRHPPTWSATVELAPALASVTRTEWLRHPACGCNWLGDERGSSTMVG